MKKIISNIILVLLFLAGLSLLLYPYISDGWNNYQQEQLIGNYEDKIKELQPEDFDKEWELARDFNKNLAYNPLYSSFGIDGEMVDDEKYWEALNVSKDGIMGYLSIPKINVKLAIYHGASESVLQTGIGHIKGTKLPIGGEGNHSVLSGHRGLPSAKLFTDIDQLKKGDMFYVHVLGETLAYQVDQILDMVDKDDVDTLEHAMELVEGKDYITLFTCTPYGVNSHRLLVRGIRVEYHGEEEIIAMPDSENMLENIYPANGIHMILGMSVAVLLLIFVKGLVNLGGKKHKKK